MQHPSPYRSICRQRARHGGHHPAIGGRGGQGKAGADQGRTEVKDEEIAKLKEQLEDLTSQRKVLTEENSSVPSENALSQAPASSQPAAPASSSQAEVPPQPEPEPSL